VYLVSSRKINDSYGHLPLPAQPLEMTGWHANRSVLSKVRVMPGSRTRPTLPAVAPINEEFVDEAP